MLKAIFFDFYGTLVEEDDKNIGLICKEVSRCCESNISSGEIGDYWYQDFLLELKNSNGNKFELQSIVQKNSLDRAIHHFKSSANSSELIAILDSYCKNPPLIDVAMTVLNDLNLIKSIVTNADESHLSTALIPFRGLYDSCFSSEVTRSYKPNSDIFLEALKHHGLYAGDVVFVGDSFSNDIIGASQLGFKTAWVNPRKRPNKSGIEPDCVIENVGQLQKCIEDGIFA